MLVHAMKEALAAMRGAAASQDFATRALGLALFSALIGAIVAALTGQWIPFLVIYFLALAFAFGVMVVRSGGKVAK